MRSVRVVLVAACLLLLASGCLTPARTGASQGSASFAAASAAPPAARGNGTGPPPTAPTLAAGRTSGAVPLQVAFILRGPEGGWALGFGDNATAASGRALPATVNHTYLKPGNFTAVLAMEGAPGANASLLVRVVPDAAAPPQPDQTMQGSVQCLPTLVLNGSRTPGMHDFTVAAGQTRLAVTLRFDPNAYTDLDMVVTDPAGTAVKSNAAGPEPPLVFNAPLAGPWHVEVDGYSCAGTAGYALTSHYG